MKKLNIRQIKVLNRLLDIGSENFKGDLTKAKYVKIANTTETNASRDIADLLAKGCIKKIEGTTGRGTKYTIKHTCFELKIPNETTIKTMEEAKNLESEEITLEEFNK